VSEQLLKGTSAKCTVGYTKKNFIEFKLFTVGLETATKIEKG